MLKYGIRKTKKQNREKGGIKWLCARGWDRWSSLSGSCSTEESEVGPWPPLERRG